MSWMLSCLNSRGSMLLQLPPELRERIFELALVSDKPLVTFHIDEYQQEDYEEAVQPPLLMVNRQVRRETLPLFYDRNDFICFTEGKKADVAASWLLCIQQYLESLGGITFWLRHVNRVPSHIGSSGAISVNMRFILRQARWVVCPEWKWISPVKKAEDASADGIYLTSKLQHLLDENATPATAEFFTTIMSTLRKSYVEHKVH